MIFQILLKIIPFLSLVTATPTPVLPNLSKRCSSSFIEPEILQIVNESAPTTSYDNTWGDGDAVTVYQNVTSTSNGSVLADRIYQVVGFRDIPTTATSCTLRILFPTSEPLTTIPSSSPAPLLSIYTFGANQLGLSSSLLFKNNYTWSSLSSPAFTNPPSTFLADVALVEDGANHTVGAVECPWTASGGGSDVLAFTLRIADGVGERGVGWSWFSTSPEGFGPGPTGFYLSYDEC